MSYYVNLQCCAVKEITNMGNDGTPLVTLQNLYSNFNGLPRAAFLLYTGVGYNRHIQRKFTAFIVQNKLGVVDIATQPSKNPNSGRNVTVYVWTIDRPALKKFNEDHGFSKLPVRDIYGYISRPAV